jgi:hypothetical protein
MIDDRRLLQVIDNLITNAARYTQRGKIKITLQKCHPTQKPSRLNSIQEKKEDYSLITLVIRDTGMGISAEEQLKIFNPLVRGSAGIKSGCKGAGMGLAIVKQVLEQLDGDIQLISEENKGTEITLHIPIYPASSDHYQSFRTENKNLTTPNAPQMKQLNNLIQQGAISDIIRWANQLNQQETLYENFTKAIILAATKGDMNGLRQLARNSDKEN